jgi:hypothetical protein
MFEDILQEPEDKGVRFANYEFDNLKIHIDFEKRIVKIDGLAKYDSEAMEHLREIHDLLGKDSPFEYVDRTSAKLQDNTGWVFA